MLQRTGPIDMKTTVFCFEHQRLGGAVVIDFEFPGHLAQLCKALLDGLAVLWMTAQGRFDRGHLSVQQLVEQCRQALGGRCLIKEAAQGCVDHCRGDLFQLVMHRLTFRLPALQLGIGLLPELLAGVFQHALALGFGLAYERLYVGLGLFEQLLGMGVVDEHFPRDQIYGNVSGDSTQLDFLGAKH